MYPTWRQVDTGQCWIWPPLVVVMWMGAVSVIVVKQSPVGGKQEFVFDCSSNEWCFPVWKHSKVSVSNFFAHKVRGQSTILSQPFVFKLAGVAVRHCQLPVRVPLLLREPRASRMHDQKCRREAQARRVLHRHRSASLLAVAADSSFFEIPPLILKIKVYVVCVLSSELMDHFFQFPIRVTCCPGPTRPSPTPSATASTRSRSIRQCWTTTCPGNSRCRSLEPSTCSISRASLTVQSFW